MSRILALHNSHNASICEIDDNNIIYFQEAERLDGIKRSTNWPILLHKYKNQNFDKIIFVDCRINNTEAKRNIKEYLILNNISYSKLVFEIKHHFYHACSAFFNSGLNNSFALVIDGHGLDKKFGNNFSSEIVSLYYFNKNKFKKIFKVYQYTEDKIEGKNIFINTISLGHMYAIVKKILNFKEEGSVMGLSCYTQYKITTDLFTNKLNHFNSNQNFLYNMITNPDVHKKPEILCKTMQTELERIVLKYVSNILKNKKRNLCVSGGVFQNTVLNSKILDICPNLYVDPFADDSGISMGGALWYSNKNKFINKKINNLNLGDLPNYNNLPSKKGYPIGPKDVAKLISEKNIVAIYQGKNELGKRALGNRSFLYDPRDPHAKDKINSLKSREWFRPTAGTILHEYVSEWFDLKSKKETPFMSYVFNVKKQGIPGITHIDNTCRIQTLKKEQNFHYYNLINEFYKLTNIPILLNTSFNLAGEPLVNSVFDAIKTLTNCYDKFKFIYFPEIGKIYETNDFL
jgi:carbamoyltransferase